MKIFRIIYFLNHFFQYLCLNATAGWSTCWPFIYFGLFELSGSQLDSNSKAALRMIDLTRAINLCFSIDHLNGREFEAVILG